MKISTSPTQFTDWYCSKHKTLWLLSWEGWHFRGSPGYFLFGLQNMCFSVNEQKDANLKFRIIPLIFATVYEHMPNSGNRFLRSGKECLGPWVLAFSGSLPVQSHSVPLITGYDNGCGKSSDLGFWALGPVAQRTRDSLIENKPHSYFTRMRISFVSRFLGSWGSGPEICESI